MNNDLPTRLQAYIKEFDDDIRLNMQNLQEKSMLISSIRSKWIRYHFLEKSAVDKLRAAKQQYAKTLIKQPNMSSMFPTVGTVEHDDKLIKLNTEIKNSEYCIEFIDKAFNVLDNFNFQIKNAVDIIKLEQL